MKIHYLSCHSILEYDEVSLLTELGHEVFSNGAYLDPKGHISLPRPAIEGAKYYEEWATIARDSSRNNLPKELIDPFDVIIVMHLPDFFQHNWNAMRNKKVVWRTIGQSLSNVENKLRVYRSDGMKIVRYSPNEANISGYIGSDAMIRFYKDEDELSGWNGYSKQVINLTQSLKGRRDFCHYNEIMAVIEQFDGKVYGMNNTDLGKYDGGEVSYNKLKQLLRHSGVFVYGGTWPASYTLGFIEAMMTGTPIVAIGKNMAMLNKPGEFYFYEVDGIIKHGESGMIANSVDEMKEYTQMLLDDRELAEKISRGARKRAVELFGKQKIKKQWDAFLKGLK